MKWELKQHREGEWRHYVLYLDGEEVSSARWAPVCGDSVEIHNVLSRSSKSVVVKARQIFNATIRSEIISAGYSRIIAVFPLDTQAPKAMRYLGLMGFEFFCGLMEA